MPCVVLNTGFVVVVVVLDPKVTLSDWNKKMLGHLAHSIVIV